MPRYFLGADIGTSSVKAGIFDEENNLIQEARSPHSFSAKGRQVDIEPMDLWDSFLRALSQLSDYLPHVAALGLSVLCPNLICMDADGNPLAPGIIHLDRRSEEQGKWIARHVGVERFHGIAGNIPCPGGMSVTSLLWMRENCPEVWAATAKVGHTNTFFLKRLTGEFLIDPSNASFIGLYDTVGNSGWSTEMCTLLDVDMGLLPQVKDSWEVAGSLTREAAESTGLKPGIMVITGGADTACAAFGSGCVEDGDLMNTTGTVEAMVLTTDKPFYHNKFLLRVGVLPNRWNVMNIIGAGGESLSWFYSQFCRDMDQRVYFEEYIPSVLADTTVVSERFTPHLAGDRTSVENKAAMITGITLGTTRDNLLKAMVNGIVEQLADGMDTFSKISKLSQRIAYTGGGAAALLALKQKTFPNFTFHKVDNCALIGIGKLILKAWNNDKPVV